MAIQALNGTSDDVLNAIHSTSDGRNYSLNYSEKITLSTNFIGQGKSNANSQGWERNSHKFFVQLEKEHPEMFSKANSLRIANHQNPIVDKRMIDHNPQFKDYKGDTLIHHHIGGDGEATALPAGMHKGYGGVHSAEKEAGITQRCKDFSNECQKCLSQNPDLKKSSSETMRTEVNRANAAQRANPNGKSGRQSPSTQKAQQTQSAQQSTKSAQQGQSAQKTAKPVQQGQSSQATVKSTQQAQPAQQGQSAQKGSGTRDRGNAISTATANRSNHQSRAAASSSRQSSISASSASGSNRASTPSSQAQRGQAIVSNTSAISTNADTGAHERGTAIGHGRSASHSSTSSSQARGASISSNSTHSTSTNSARGAAISSSGHSHSSGGGHSSSSGGGHSSSSGQSSSR